MEWTDNRHPLHTVYASVDDFLMENIYGLVQMNNINCAVFLLLNLSNAS